MNNAPWLQTLHASRHADVSQAEGLVCAHAENLFIQFNSIQLQS